MTRQPVPLHMQLPAAIKSAVKSLGLHTQQITTLQSQAAAAQALVPGDWESILMTGGWSAQSGFIPPQVRILQNGMSQIIGHITGGTTTNGTVIGTLTSGFFNTVHAHTFAANAVTGAAAVSHAGAVSNPAVSTGSLADLASSPQSSAGGTSAQNFGNPGASYSQSYAQGQQQQFNALLAYVVAFANDYNQGTVLHNSGTLNAGQALSSTATATAVNMNSPTITLSTAGVLTIQNVDPNVTTLSFGELIPLITA